MGLAGVGVAQRNDVLAAQDELAACQFQHQQLVETGDGAEVECIKALRCGEPGLPDAPLDHAAL